MTGNRPGNSLNTPLGGLFLYCARGHSGDNPLIEKEIDDEQWQHKQADGRESGSPVYLTPRPHIVIQADRDGFEQSVVDEGVGKNKFIPGGDQVHGYHGYNGVFGHRKDDPEERLPDAGAVDHSCLKQLVGHKFVKGCKQVNGHGQVKADHGQDERKPGIDDMQGFINLEQGNQRNMNGNRNAHQKEGHRRFAKTEAHLFNGKPRTGAKRYQSGQRASHHNDAVQVVHLQVGGFPRLFIIGEIQAGGQAERLIVGGLYRRFEAGGKNPENWIKLNHQHENGQSIKKKRDDPMLQRFFHTALLLPDMNLRSRATPRMLSTAKNTAMALA